MSKAALYIAVDAYDTKGARLMGRHAAGESFLRGYLRHAQVDRYWFYNAFHGRQEDLERFVAQIGAVEKPITWINGHRRNELAQAGLLYIPAPQIGVEAWQRRIVGARRYAICGVTHTTATAAVMDMLTNMLVAPLEDYDTLICTSEAVRASIETQLDMMRDYMKAEYGPRRRAEFQRTTIPLGVNVSDFATTPERRKEWRERLEIPDDAVVALFVGRFNVRGKMNPALMAMALERAAKRTKTPIVWVNAGWGESEKEEAYYHQETAKLCPSVRYIHLDGRKPDVRFPIWSVGDFFISFSDNIQETFGLTPVEAMAAGIPAVVSDWDGYKDTVRNGQDGFRITTYAPRPGLGGDMAYWFANHWLTYENYIGAASQATAVDLGEAEDAILALVDNPDLRRRMGESARRQAQAAFDWAAIIPQYQAVWAEQHARLAAAAADGADVGSQVNPLRPDPFTLFASYPTRPLANTDVVRLVEGMDPRTAAGRLAAPLAVYSRINRPSDEEVALVLTTIQARGEMSVAEIRDLFPPPRRNFIERGVLWLLRHDVLALERGR